MTKSPLISFFILLPFFFAPAQETTVADPMRVTEKPLASVKQTGQDDSIATALESLPGVVVLTQGEAVGQTDLSIRGSSFSGAGLSLFGLSLGNAQTEHFNAELPFPSWWFARPVVLTGVSQAQQSEGHLTGTVALRPMPLENRNTFTVGVDNKDGYWGNAGSQKIFRQTEDSQTGAGVFAGFSEIPDVDFPDNDVKVARGGARIQHLTNDGVGDLMFGHQDKTFGARGYYGVNDALKAEERTKDTLLTGSWQNFESDQNWDASLLFRQFEDDYKLWLPTSLFRNQHKTRTAAAQAGREFLISDSLILQSRIAADLEDIDSNSLGDFSRYRVTATLVPEWQVSEHVRLSAGVRGEVLEEEDDQLLPLARIDIALKQNLGVYAEISQTVRRPSYTELNYESPGSLGNSGLDLQEQTASEAGLVWSNQQNVTLEASVFFYDTSNTVDWVRPDEAATRWQAENIGDVETLGTELVFEYLMGRDLKIFTSYMWMDKNPDEAPYASRYTLDYARHYVRVQLDWTPADWIRFELSQGYREQVENALRTEGGNEQWLTDLAVHFRAPSIENLQLSLMASNATDDDYRVFPGQNTVTNRRVSAGLTLDW